MHKEKNYYEILDSKPDDDFNQIQSNYQRVKNTYSIESPALYSLMNEDECQKVLNMIEEAYSILGDPQKRKMYDQARGIEGYSNKVNSPNAQNLSTPKVEEASNERKVDLKKIVASNRFQLNFEKDEQFETEIEKTEVFDGPFLKKIREYKQVDIPKLADMTKVSKTYLKNIESENLDNLPAPVYIRGFVFQYAKCLKLNPDLVANSYMAQIKEKQRTD